MGGKAAKKEPSSKEGFAFRIGSAKQLKLRLLMNVTHLLSTAAAPRSARDLWQQSCIWEGGSRSTTWLITLWQRRKGLGHGVVGNVPTCL